eukprot:scaffold77695_cov33-Attheya_sp.AAC.1
MTTRFRLAGWWDGYVVHQPSSTSDGCLRPRSLTFGAVGMDSTNWQGRATPAYSYSIPPVEEYNWATHSILPTPELFDSWVATANETIDVDSALPEKAPLADCQTLREKLRNMNPRARLLHDLGQEMEIWLALGDQLLPGHGRFQRRRPRSSAHYFLCLLRHA